jgi:hypothetical protein
MTCTAELTGGRVGGVSLHEHRWPFSANQPAREVWRHIQNELDFPASQQTTGGFLGFDMVDDREVSAVFHCVNEPPQEWTVVRGKHGDGKVLRIGVNREAEENELDNRNAKHHRKRETIATHLNKLLAQDRNEPSEIESKHQSRAPQAFPSFDLLVPWAVFHW